MNSVDTAATRPRMWSGVTSCTSVWRTNTETMSAPPSTASIATDSQRNVDRPNTSVATP